jgi:hypothetical protein
MSGHEISHDKLRITGARLSDHANHADGANGRDRSRDHTVYGRFAVGNRAAAGTGAKRAIRHLVPARARGLFADLCAQLGASGGTLAYMHAADTVCHQLDALELGELARAAGLASAEGAALHVRAQRSSELAIRSATAALETSRLFRRPSATKRKAGPPPGFEGGAP